nr:reverse transcriptase domain-containing protein [Tanacetum cinerariifolium]
MEAQYGKFLDMIRAIRINVPLVDVLAGMPNYGKFLKELVSNKHKLEQISSTFLSDEIENMFFEVSKFTFPVDFVILEMEEDSKVPLILGRPFLHIVDAGMKSFIPSRELFSKKNSLLHIDEFMAMNIKENSESKYETEEPPFK